MFRIERSRRAPVAGEILREIAAKYKQIEAPRPQAGATADHAHCRDAAGRALRIADFIAGMTDRYAMVEHARLFGATPELR